MVRSVVYSRNSIYLCGHACHCVWLTRHLASASDGWYVLSFTQEIRFASVVMPVIVSGSLVALASVSDRWYALSFIQEGRFASVGGHACHCVRFTRRLASVSDGWYVCHLFKEVDLPLWSCLFDTKSYESTIRAYSPGSTPGVRLLFLSYPLYVLTVIVSGSLALYHVSFYCVGSFCGYVSFACCRLVRLASIYWAHVTCT